MDKRIAKFIGKKLVKAVNSLEQYSNTASTSDVFPNQASQPYSYSSVDQGQQYASHTLTNDNISAAIPNDNIPAVIPNNNIPAVIPNDNIPAGSANDNIPSGSPNDKISEVIQSGLLLSINSRVHSTCKSMGTEVVLEARLGLSRILTPNSSDLEHFAYQLRQSDKSATESDWQNVADKIPCFAISYEQHNPSVGRFKFSDEQWDNFKAAVASLAAGGVTHFRVWLDQCLWLRDASQESWAHTGLIPYVMWPVISLGVKELRAERTIATYTRMWPFVEEIGALWGLGLIVTRQMRDRNSKGGHRRCMTYTLRHLLEPELTMRMILLNVFHGATDDLHTGWQDDKEELNEIARWNVMTTNGNQIFIGSDWKARMAMCKPVSWLEVVQSIQLPARVSMYGIILGDMDLYIDRSRTLQSNGWNGLTEWLSGNQGAAQFNTAEMMVWEYIVTKYNVLTNDGEYQFLKLGHGTSYLWMLVAMDGRSSNFSRGKVLWTKILCGLSSCHMSSAMEAGNVLSVQDILSVQLQRRVHITSAQKVTAPVQWV